MIKYLQRRFALSERGAHDLIKGVVGCVLQNIAFMLPVSLLCCGSVILLQLIL